MHYLCRSFLAPGQAGFWSQYWENEPDDPSLIFNRGHLFGLVNLISSQSDADLSSIGRQLITEINNRYFSPDSPNITPPILHSILQTLFSEAEFQPYEISLSIVLIQNRKLYLFCYGPSQIILKRQDNISLLLSGVAGTIKTLTGPLDLNDRIFLTTQPFYNKIGWEKIKLRLKIPQLSSLEEEFISDLYSQADPSSLAAALIQINPDDELITNPPPAPVLPELEPEPPTPKLPPTPQATSSFSSPFPSSSTQPHLSTKTSRFSPFTRLFAGSRDTFVSPMEVAVVSRRRKFNLVLAFVILLGLALSSVFGYRKNQSIMAENKYQSLKTEIQKKIDNAQAVKNLSLENALASAKEADNLAKEMKLLNLHSDEVTSYEKQIKTLLNLTGDTSQPAGEYFYDTSLLTNSPQYRYLKINQDRFYLLDNQTGRLDSVGVQNHTKETLSTDSVLKNSAGLAFDQNTPYVISGDELFTVSSGKLTSKLKLTANDKPLTSPEFYFWNGSLYILDTVSSAIWKYTPSADSFGKAQNWLKDTHLPDGTVSFAINGKIWILSANGKITPYNRGTAENFNLPQQSPIKSASKLVTTPNTEFLAFVDDNSVIYVYRKNGDTVGRYNFNDKKVYDFALDEDASVLYVLCSDEKIYKLEL